MKAVEIITLITCLLTAAGMGYFAIETKRRLRKLRVFMADVNASNLESLMETRREIEKDLMSLAEALNLIGGEQVAQHQAMATHSEDQHEESLQLLSNLLTLVKSQAAELTEHANRITVHAQQIIDARHQDQGNVVIPRMICSICQRVVFRWAMHEEKPVCQDCISSGRHLPPPPPPPVRQSRVIPQKRA